MNKKKILAIVGSTRKNSVNELILKLIASLYTDALDVKIYRELTVLPYFNPDITDEELPLSVKNFRNEIKESDGVMICTPEYVFSLPGALKNALEWTVSTTVFSEKPVSFIVASGLGEKTFESLTLIMTTLGARMEEHSTLLIQGARAKFKPHHVVDEQVLADIRRLASSFINALNTPLSPPD